MCTKEPIELYGLQLYTCVSWLSRFTMQSFERTGATVFCKLVDENMLIHSTWECTLLLSVLWFVLLNDTVVVLSINSCMHILTKQCWLVFTLFILKIWGFFVQIINYTKFGLNPPLIRFVFFVSLHTSWSSSSKFLGWYRTWHPMLENYF